MKTVFFKIFILILILNSCKKEEIKTEIFAGKYDAGMNYTELFPPQQIELKTDSANYTKYGMDSIDINLDGNFDLIFSQRLFFNWNDSAEISNNNYPFCILIMKNGLEIASISETIYIGQGQTSKVFWVEPLIYNSSINNITQWSETDPDIWMWVVPPATFWGTNGPWYNINETEKYIGIRMKENSEYKLGWIRAYQYSREKFEILSYAIEK
jgi:hypothetical protein